MGALFSRGQLARRDKGAWPQRPVIEEQRGQVPARKQPSGLLIFDAAAALLVSHRSIRIFSLLAPSSSAKSRQRARSPFMRWVLVSVEFLDPHWYWHDA